MTHLLRATHPTPFEEGRREAVSYCGHWEECSGSGKHRMAIHVSDADCPWCREEYEEDQYADWVDMKIDEAKERDFGLPSDD